MPHKTSIKVKPGLDRLVANISKLSSISVMANFSSFEN